MAEFALPHHAKRHFVDYKLSRPFQRVYEIAEKRGNNEVSKQQLLFGLRPASLSLR